MSLTPDDARRLLPELTVAAMSDCDLMAAARRAADGDRSRLAEWAAGWIGHAAYNGRQDGQGPRLTFDVVCRRALAGAIRECRDITEAEETS